MYAICIQCGHKADYWKNQSDSFKPFSPKVDLTKLTRDEIYALDVEDLEIECPKCGSDDVTFTK